MKKTKTLSILLGAAILACAVSLPRLGRAADQAKRRGIPHEEMDAALVSLREARAHLERGGHTFAGNREKAVRTVDKAVFYVQAAIDYANAHDR
jgi:hypothetical protein